MATLVTILIPVDGSMFDEMVRFYAKVLELGKVEIGESDIGNPWCTLNVSGTTITIHAARDGRFPYPEFRPTEHGIGFSFQVSNLERMEGRLKGHGVDLLNAWGCSDGSRAISVADPAGNVLELWQDAA